MDYDLASGMAVLSRTPDSLRAMLAGLPDSWLDGNEGPDTWSPRDVVAHLIHAERNTWITRAEVILAPESDHIFPAFDRVGHLARPRNIPINALLDEFAMVRTESLTTLQGWNLSEEDFALTGVHPAFGTVTLKQLLATWVAHDLGHTAQIVRAMAKQYRDAVGPWQEYLSIMKR